MGNNFFGEYPDDLVANICDGPDFIIGLGSATTTANEQLEYLGVMLVKIGLQPLVTMRINAYRGVTLVGQSQLMTCSGIEAEYPAGPNFLGWIRFLFDPRLNLAAAVATRFELELFDYTYSETDHFIGAVFDWPTTMGYNDYTDQISASPMALELYGAQIIE